MTTNKEEDVIDSQLIAENIGFLDNCFDNSFNLQNSIIAVKEYISEEKKESALNTEPSQKIRWTQIAKCNKVNLSVCDITQKITENVENEKLSKLLIDWGLPIDITRKYERKGIVEMFDWQVICLSNSKVLLDCCNLVYSAPTSAGKTLVAEILTIKTVLERQKKVVIILPFVSIVREKMFYLQDILSSSGIRVEGFMGAQSPPGGLQAVHVAICTIEKANSLINQLLDSNNISELGAVIVDELHLLGDPHRGYILELLLTKIIYVSSKFDDVQIQIVGMSATLPNLDILANWLSAELYVTQFRPIPLEEYCLVENKLHDKDGKHIRNLHSEDKDVIPAVDNVLQICLDTIKDGCSLLIFCMTKNRCENLAQTLSAAFFKMGCSANSLGTMLRSQLNSDAITEVLEQLKNCPVGLDHILKSTISFGVAYHHAGLTFDERDIIEGGFKSGAIRVLVATSTLSSGVNLPARKVIIRTPVFQKQPINILTYKQMIGRAGRMGKDVKGESILICTEAEKKIGFNLMMGALDPVESCIEREDKFMRAILEMIASQVANTKFDLEFYSKCTLLFTQNLSFTQNSLLENTLKELVNYELVRVQKDGEIDQYVATPLGKACLSSSMAPNDGLSLFCELQKARQCLVLETDLHLIYLVTPYSVSSQWGDIDWLHLLTLWESLTKAMKRVGELVGVQESFIIRCLRATNKLGNVQNKLNIHKRFYTSLALQDLVNEVPLSEVAKKFQCARGFLQSLQQAAATFAGMVTSFCRQLGWNNVEILISQFQDRLHFGIHSELIELMKLPSLNGSRARTLFDAGYETISSIASADVNVIENILRKAVPFQSEKEREADDKDDIRKRSKIKNIWITGHCGMTVEAAAENLILEARRYLELEIGVAEIKWNSKLASSIQDNPDLIGQNRTTIMEQNIINDPAVQTKKRDSNDNAEILKTSNISVLVENETQLSDNSDLSKKSGKENVFDKKMVSQLSANTSSAPDFKYRTQNCNYTNISTCANIKDEILWDSLNFTENAMRDITKVRTSDRVLSPNISFSDTEDITSSRNHSLTNALLSKPHLNKDISLFSSDGESSSLFEESLQIDLISTKNLDDDTKTNDQSNIPVLQSNFISNSNLNEFKTKINDDTDVEDDIKLYYEDGESENNSLNTAQDIEVKNTLKDLPEEIVKSPLKRQASSMTDNSKVTDEFKPKKAKSSFFTNHFKETDDRDLHPSITRNSLSFKVEINCSIINCFDLQENDIKNTISLLENMKEVSLFLDSKKSVFLNNEVIGSKILKEKACNVSNFKAASVKGVVVFNGENTCFYLDLSSIENNPPILQRISNWLKRASLRLKVFSLKSNYLFLKQCLDWSLSPSCYDISVAEWLIDSEEKIPNIVYLVKKYMNMDLPSVTLKIDNKVKKWKNVERTEKLCINAWLVWKISEIQERYLLEKYQSVRNVLDIEIKVSRILSSCEYYGVGVDKELASQLLIDVRNSQDILQKKAYKLCGYHFNFNSSKDVAKVLGIYKGRKISTKKSVLTAHNSTISSLIIYWRKLNSILTKTLYPLTEKACIYSHGNRITPSYTMYTCTGRISMHEPNLQNVPRTFSIPVKYLTENGESSNDIIEFNCRNVFKAPPGFVFVSADYCQLEMRILTHYSKDPVLMDIMRSDVDVFRSIAASWGGIPEDKVDDDLRQKAKQLCYGILYGMGNRTLGHTLDVSEMEAAVFMDTFYKMYPDIRVFTQTVLQDCRDRGYVETLMKRRRYLPDIKHCIPSKKCAAERQALNTTIQGSAADIAKSAMCAIDDRTSTLAGDKPKLILQMHDELIYELPVSYKDEFVKIIKECMEKTVCLRVPLPVKVKTGFSWGEMKEISIV